MKAQIIDYYRSLTPSDWFKNGDERNIWVSAFRIFGIEKDHFVKPATIRLDDVVIDINYGSIPYGKVDEILADFTEISETSVKIKEVHPPATRVESLRHGPFMLIVSPIVVDNSVEQETYQKEKILKVAGLIAALNSRWLTYKHLFDNTFNIDDGNFVVSTEWLSVPVGFKIFNLDGMNIIKLANKHLESMDRPRRDRINLALHWHMLSVLDKGIDAFIKSWIALEALAMPSSDVRPINEKLSEIYNINYKDAGDRFKIGRIQGLRSDVVHNGKRINIDGKLLIYLEAVFVDLLIDELRLEKIYYVKKVMDRDDFSFDKIFQ